MRKILQELVTAIEQNMTFPEVLDYENNKIQIEEYMVKFDDIKEAFEAAKDRLMDHECYVNYEEDGSSETVFRGTKEACERARDVFLKNKMCDGKKITDANVDTITFDFNN